MKTVEIGKIGETIAAKYLKKNKYRIISRNVHVSHNEIDIIAKNKNFIVFVEVKTRSTDQDLTLTYGTPASAVDYKKKKRTVEAARVFLKDKKYSKLQPRFDVVEVYLDKYTHKQLHINYIENAFGA